MRREILEVESTCLNIGGRIGAGKRQAQPMSGWATVAISRPTKSDVKEAIINQLNDLTAILPTAPPDEPRLAIPETIVAKTNGAMIILIIRRKISEPIVK